VATKATRFIFEYDGDQIRLVAQKDVDMEIHAPATPAATAPGHYVDARDAGERTLARVAAPGAFAASAEVFPEHHADPITRIDVPRRGAFTVTLPALDGADHLTVVRIGRPVGRGAEAEPQASRATDLASFPLQPPLKTPLNER
jgi:hypothetical protein